MIVFYYKKQYHIILGHVSSVFIGYPFSFSCVSFIDLHSFAYNRVRDTCATHVFVIYPKSCAIDRFESPPHMVILRNIEFSLRPYAVGVKQNSSEALGDDKQEVVGRIPYKLRQYSQSMRYLFTQMLNMTTFKWLGWGTTYDMNPHFDLKGRIEITRDCGHVMLTTTP